MQFNSKWLLALSLAALLAPAPLLAADGETHLSGFVEAGAAGMAVSDDVKRVNEYSVIRADQGVNPYGRVDLTGLSGDVLLDVQAERMSSRDQKYNLGIDLERILRFETSYDTFLHWLDHDKLDYIDAGVRSPSLLTRPNGEGTPPILSPDSIPGGFSAFDPLTNQVTPGTPGQPGVQQIGRATVFAEDFVPNQDFSIVRREWKNSADLTLPFLPMVTFHAGYRVEEREGMEQSIGMSKCTVCHITGQSREVDEQTKDFTAGATGRFGLLTVDYTYLDREFRERAAPPTRIYDPALNPGQAFAENSAGSFENRLLFDYRDGVLPYDTTPDSDKKSHILKARADLPRNTAILGSYVNSEVTSRKTEEPGIFTLDKLTLKTTYDAYGVRASTRLGRSLTLTARAKLEEIENDPVTVTFEPIGLPGGGFGGNPDNIDLEAFAQTRESVITRDIYTFGLDGMYRLARYSTVRLGYEFRKDDREDDHFGTTETHTVKASVKTRPTKNVSAWAGYTYKDIDNPFANHDAALYRNPETGLHYFDKDGNVATTFGDSSTWTPGYFLGNGPTYGREFYDQRVADLTNQPETVHEARLSATWTPSPHFAGTVTYRGTFEKNDLDFSQWQQDTHNPGVSMWYSPTNRLSLTLAYNYLMQEVESAFCQGWYDG